MELGRESHRYRDPEKEERPGEGHTGEQAFRQRPSRSGQAVIGGGSVVRTLNFISHPPGIPRRDFCCNYCCLVYFRLCWLSAADHWLSLFAAARRLLIAVTSLVAEPRTPGARASEVVAQGPWSTGSAAVAHRLSCPEDCGIIPDQGSHPCPLRWPADS